MLAFALLFPSVALAEIEWSLMTWSGSCDSWCTATGLVCSDEALAGIGSVDDLEAINNAVGQSCDSWILCYGNGGSWGLPFIHKNHIGSGECWSDSPLVASSSIDDNPLIAPCDQSWDKHYRICPCQPAPTPAPTPPQPTPTPTPRPTPQPTLSPTTYAEFARNTCYYDTCASYLEQYQYIEGLASGALEDCINDDDALVADDGVSGFATQESCILSMFGTGHYTPDCRALHEAFVDHQGCYHSCKYGGTYCGIDVTQAEPSSGDSDSSKKSQAKKSQGPFFVPFVVCACVIVCLLCVIVGLLLGRKSTSAKDTSDVRAETEASRSAATTTANPLAQAGSEVPTASPIGRVVEVVRSWSSGLLRQAPPTASAATARPTCEVLEVEKPAPEAEQPKQPSGESPPPYAHRVRSFMPPRGIPGRSPRAPPPSGAFMPPRGIPAGVPPRAPPPYPGAARPPRGIEMKSPAAKTT